MKLADESNVACRVTVEVRSRAKTSRTAGRSSVSTASCTKVKDRRSWLASPPSWTGFSRPLPATHKTAHSADDSEVYSFTAKKNSRMNTFTLFQPT